MVSTLKGFINLMRSRLIYLFILIFSVGLGVLLVLEESKSAVNGLNDSAALRKSDKKFVANKNHNPTRNDVSENKNNLKALKPLLEVTIEMKKPEPIAKPKSIKKSVSKIYKGGSKRLNDLWLNEKGEMPNVWQRSRAISHLGINLTEEEVQSLFNYIKEGPSESVMDLAVLDRVMMILEQREDMVEEVVTQMISLSQDTSIAGPVRGYLMQHLGLAYETRISMREKLEKSFYEGLKDTETDVAGTAIMIMVRLQKEHPKFDDDVLKKAAHDLAKGINSNKENQISALSLLGQLKVKTSLPTLRDQVVNGKNTVVKVAAIHSLGLMGEEEDFDLLNDIVKGKTNKFLRNAAIEAVKIIKINI